MTSTITVGGGPVTLVALPKYPAPRRVQFDMQDSVAVVKSIFTGQTQAQQWPGADSVSVNVDMPPLTADQARPWKAFLMQLRGQACALQLEDPNARHSQGLPGSSVPLVNGAVSTDNAAMAQTLVTKGWVPSSFRLLLPYDALQIGYRFHYVLNQVDSDASGNATLAIFPSLREQPADGTPIILNRPKGLFRLAQNKRGWSDDYTRITTISFDLTEYR